MRKIGVILKERRLAEKKKIASLAAALKLSPSYLRALERNDFAAIPGGMAIVQGMVRRYAQALGLDPDKAAAIFRRDFSQASPRLLPLSEEERPRFSFTPSFWSLVLLLLAVFLLLFFLFQNLLGFLKAPLIKVETPREGEIIKGDFLTVKGKLKWGDVLSINGQKTEVNDQGFFSKEIHCEKGENTLLLEAANPREKKTVTKINFVCQ